LEDSARLHPGFTSFDFETIIFFQSKVVSLAPTPQYGRFFFSAFGRFLLSELQGSAEHRLLTLEGVLFHLIQWTFSRMPRIGGRPVAGFLPTQETPT
jgi:hypothetical protein